MGRSHPLNGSPKSDQTASDKQSTPIEKRAFSDFFAREWPKLRLYLRGRVGEDEAEDIAQEAFARVARTGDVRHASGLLYAAARSLVIDGARARVRANAVLVHDADLEALADPAPSPEDEMHWRGRLHDVSDMLDQMSDKCRAVFVMRVFDEMSYGEIAGALNMSVLAVEKRLLRAYDVCSRWNGVADRKRRARNG
ncbi:MAG TPA: sigma-70 family RNA polymerase sigma factor [Verrucomicrobiae bacterium]|nr:sigma-70 family RNA polymerase sigma factor [Verrucomicrobiae bacterium]